MKRWFFVSVCVLLLAGSGCSPTARAGEELQAVAPEAPAVTTAPTIDLSLPVFLTPTAAKTLQAPAVLLKPVEETPAPEILPTQGEIPMLTPFAPGVDGLVERATADLAQKLSIQPAEIKVLEAAAVTWPNASLGCPQDGMVYAEVLTAGYRIVLETGGRQYEYHASQGSELFYCPNPTAPVEGAPGNS